ncbi:hypothetical protein IT575_10835 [bacterium]|nr:hypothetical protein [bacterium]
MPRPEQQGGRPAGPRRRPEADSAVRRPPPQRQRFALLLGGSAPSGEISLIEADEAQVRHRFVPLADATIGRVNFCLGLIPVQDDRHRLRLRESAAHRGRVGGKKPDRLLLLQAAPEDFSAWPRVRREGFSKAAVNQGTALSAEPEARAPYWWLALELARTGFADSAEFRAECLRFDCPSAMPPEEVVKAPGRLVARDYLRRCAAEVSARMQRLRRKNPFWKNADLAHILQWQPGLDPRLAALVLEELSSQPQPEGSLRTPERPVLETAGFVLDMVEREEPVLLQKLQEQMPSDLHVLAWLTEAHELLVSPYGVLFSRSQLMGWLRSLPKAKPGIENVPGTGELRALGLPRRKAEALHDILLAWPWLLQEAQQQRKPAPKRAGAGAKPRPKAPPRPRPADG